MILRRLRLANFKSYRGEHVFELAPRTNGKVNRNLILIGGMNGAGKTSLLEALRLCLYGSLYRGARLGASDYEKLLLSKLNTSAFAAGTPRAEVGLELVYDENGVPLDISITRSWSRDQQGKISEDLMLQSHGKVFELVPRDSWQDFVLGLIPPHVFDLFFFDGERIKELASGEESDRIFHEAIYDLLELRRYEVLAKDLQSLTGAIKRRNLKDAGVQSKLDSLQQAISDKSKTLESVISEIDGLLDESRGHSKKQDDIEQEIKRRVGETSSATDTLKSRRLELQQIEQELGSKVRELCEGYIPFVLGARVSKDLLKQLKTERQRKEALAATVVLRDSEWPLVERVTNSKKLKDTLTNGQRSAVELEIKRGIQALINGYESKEISGLLHDLSSSDSGRIESFLVGIQSETEAKIRGLLKRREENKDELDALYSRLSGSSEANIDAELKELAFVRNRVGEIEHAMGMLKERRRQIEAELQSLDGEKQQLEDRLDCADEDKSKLALAQRIIDLINEYKEIQVSSRIGELEATITHAYRKLANKRDMVERIEIDEETFEVTLINKSGVRVDRESISAGEQEIFAIAVLWGLAEMSGHRMPMIIDTPLAKLDSRHVKSIATKFFPAASHQVILLSQDREIDQSIYNALKSRIDHSFTISLGEQNKVKEGYFFE